MKLEVTDAERDMIYCALSMRATALYGAAMNVRETGDKVSSERYETFAQAYERVAEYVRNAKS